MNDLGKFMFFASMLAGYEGENTSLSIEDVRCRSKVRMIKPIRLPNGVHEYLYTKNVGDDEITVKILARNKKNADRKARNAGCFVI